MSDMTDQGCSDGGCDLRDRRGGQHTNGGCHCLDALDGDARFRLRRYMRHTREARDSLATQLEQMRRDLADLRARGVVPDADCTCGSGGHPRPCAKHPHRMEMHAREIDTENALEQMRRERDEARATIDAAWKATGVAGAVRGLTTLEDVVQCHRRDLMEARAKLARIREVAECDYHDTPRTVLRIIDEKEGGQ